MKGTDAIQGKSLVSSVIDPISLRFTNCCFCLNIEVFTWSVQHCPRCTFTAKSNSERILKIGKHLAKLQTRLLCRFLTHSVELFNRQKQ